MEVVTACLAVAVVVLALCLRSAHEALARVWARYLRELRRASRLERALRRRQEQDGNHSE